MTSPSRSSASTTRRGSRSRRTRSARTPSAPRRSTWPSPRRARASRTYPKATIARLCLASAYPGLEERTGLDQQAVEGFGPRRRRTRSRRSTSRARSRYGCSYDVVQGAERHGEADGGAARADELRSDERDAARAGHRGARATPARRETRCPSIETARQGEPGRSAVPAHLLARAPRREATTRTRSRPVRRTSPPIRRRRTPSYYLRMIADYGSRQRVREGGRDGGDGGAEVSRRTRSSGLLKAQNERKAGQLPAASASLAAARSRSIRRPRAPTCCSRRSTSTGTSRTAPSPR